jgi:hypothetical protein
MKYSHLIVTERDLVRKACVRDIGSGNIPIKDIMSTLPLVAIDSRSPVEAAANTMIQNKVRHLLVINDNDMNKIVGIITPTDFVGYLKENLNVDNELNAKLLEFLREPGGESETVTLTGERVGRFGSSGSIKWRGSLFYGTPSGAKLASLNNMVGVFEAEIDTNGNFSEKVWEWK